MPRRGCKHHDQQRFDTFSQSNLMLEAEDFDFGYDQFIDNPVPTAEPAANSYYMEAIPAIVGLRSNHAR